MKQNQIPRAGFARNLCSGKPRRMSPTASRARELLRRVLRVVDENIRAAGEFYEVAIEFRVAGFVVGRVGDDSRRRFKSQAQASLWMIQPADADFRVVYLK